MNIYAAIALTCFGLATILLLYALTDGCGREAPLRVGRRHLPNVLEAPHD